MKPCYDPAVPRNKTFEPEEALNGMMQVFWKKGFHATSISELERATGLNKRSLYNAFGDKEAIFDAVLRVYIQNAAAMRDVLRRQPQGVRNVKGFFAQIKNPDSRGCLLTKTINQSMLVAPQACQTVRASLLELEKLFFVNLMASIRSRSKARRLATYLSSSYQGISTMSTLDPSPARLRHVVKSVVKSLEAELS